ncbi:MAG TPA: HU family DNA-binding protein, partial [Caulobacteraceae bacterium]|nr:HU family DNA-binding protein [Caulobacteraceae bacterium]
GMARNPRTGQSVPRPASTTARFRVGEGLKGALNG